MSLGKDILRQCLYMSIFIIPLPIGAYTIHNGSSAVVALLTYLVLSLWIPVAYLRSDYARFGKEEKPISWRFYVLWWIILRIGLYYGESLWKGSGFWSFPSIGRDVVFSVFMYIELCVIMGVSYITTRLFSTTVNQEK